MGQHKEIEKLAERFGRNANKKKNRDMFSELHTVSTYQPKPEDIDYWGWMLHASPEGFQPRVQLEVKKSGQPFREWHMNDRTSTSHAFTAEEVSEYAKKVLAAFKNYDYVKLFFHLNHLTPHNFSSYESRYGTWLISAAPFEIRETVEAEIKKIEPEFKTIRKQIPE